MTRERGFTRKIEDFTCEHCGVQVTGDGYTDHCPRCLWGKHVDILPGDRAAECHGAMEPIAVEGTTPKYRIRYRCTRCGHPFVVKVAVADDPAALVALAARRAARN